MVSVRAAALVLVSLVAGCDSGRGGKPAAPAAVPPPALPRPEPFDAGPVRAAAEYLAEPRFAAADLARGELLALACAACHKFKAGEGTLIGPSLNGVFGRPAATVSGFAYSPALAALQLTWTPVSLEAWLTEPTSFVPGTTMAFAGYRSAEDRRDLIAYLLRVTQ